MVLFLARLVNGPNYNSIVFSRLKRGVPKDVFVHVVWQSCFLLANSINPFLFRIWKWRSRLNFSTAVLLLRFLSEIIQ